jgi:hypothetical protein
MDEDDQPAHKSWMGTDWIAMSNANPNVKTDMNTFLGQMAAQYFQTCQAQLKAVFPNIMYLGPVPCSPPLSQYTCGGEAGNYGDVVTPVTSANLLWITKP